MTMQADGTARCDRCGADLGNGSTANAVVIATLGDDDVVRTLHLGLATRCGCARRVLTAAATRWFVDNVADRGHEPGKPVPLFAGRDEQAEREQRGAQPERPPRHPADTGDERPVEQSSEPAPAGAPLASDADAGSTA